MQNSDFLNLDRYKKSLPINNNLFKNSYVTQ